MTIPSAVAKGSASAVVTMTATKERGDLVPKEEKLKTIALVTDRVRKHVRALRAELAAAGDDPELATMPHRDVIKATGRVLTMVATKIRSHLEAIETLLKEAEIEIAAHRKDSPCGTKRAALSCARGGVP
jgi:hypothetical protein